MTFDFTFFALGIPAAMLAGISKGGFGSGAAFAATPILALILPPDLAVGILLPLLMLIDVAALKAYWRKWSRVDAKRLILGAIPGTALGALLWSVADADLLRLLIGGIAVGFVIFQLATARGWIRAAKVPAGAVAGLVAGCGAGFTSFISHAGGPVVAMYLLSRKLTKTEYQATTVIVFWVGNLMKIGPFAYIGLISGPSLLAGLYLAPAALIGTWLGVRAHAIVPERAYFAFTYLLLTLAGSKLIFDALT